MDLGVGQEGRSHPFFFEILYYFYRILRKIKSIYIADKWASVPATVLWIFWVRPLTDLFHQAQQFKKTKITVHCKVKDLNKISKISLENMFNSHKKKKNTKKL